MTDQASPGPGWHWDLDYHPHEDTVRVFVNPPAGVLRRDSDVLVTEQAVSEGYVLRHYAFSGHWFKINLTLDLDGHPVEYGDGGFAFNCDLATPMIAQGQMSLAVDLFLDVLIGADGRSHRVCDEDELEDAIGRGWVSQREAAAARRGAEEFVELAHSGRLLAFLDEALPLVPSRAAPALSMERHPVDPELLPGRRPSW